MTPRHSLLTSSAICLCLCAAGLVPATSNAYPEQKVTASDGGSNDMFGISVGVVGATSVIGAWNATVSGKVGQGAVYVFGKSNGLWSQTQKLVAGDGAAGDTFGEFIAFSGGNTIIVTAPNATVSGHHSQGAAYVFSKTGTTWTQTQKLTASDGVAHDTFGEAIALSGTTLMIGAGGSQTNGVFVLGSVYCFNLSGSTWTQTQRILAPDPSDNAALFGWQIAISGTTAIIGAHASTVGSNPGQGAVYIYNQSAGSWSESAKLTASDGVTYDHFGNAVALQGTTVLVGALDATIGSHNGQGAVYYFALSGGSWSQKQKFTPPEGTATFFGVSVNLLNAAALIGAYGNDSDRGAAYVFNKAGSTWTQTTELSASDGISGDVFGYFSALDTGTGLIGSYTADIAGNTLQGAAYFYSENCFILTGGLCP